MAAVRRDHLLQLGKKERLELRIVVEADGGPVRFADIYHRRFDRHVKAY